uniref:Cnidarian restricted protein n=2 Tax=Clytia hemisphaerica TaxID=252671 RepID=A0A7M5XMV5_9CNID
MNFKIFLVSFAFLCCTWMSCSNADLFQVRDFKMLECSEQRNITLIINNLSRRNLYRLTSLLDDVIENEACYAVYVYQKDYDNSIRLRKGNDTQLEMFFDADDYPYIESIEPYKTLRFLNQKLMDENASKQTLVYMTSMTYYNSDETEQYKLLKRLQNERSWDIIIQCGYGGKNTCPLDFWMPMQRIFPKVPNSFFIYPYDWLNFVEIIKNPKYDPYEFTYHTIRSRQDFFNQTCLKNVKTLYVVMKTVTTFYFPMAAAILRKENSERKKINKKLLNIKFLYDNSMGIEMEIIRNYYTFTLERIARNINANLLIGSYNRRYLIAEENVVFQFYDRNRRLSETDCKTIKRHKWFVYRHSERRMKPSCFGIKMKTLTSTLDLYEFINKDLC